MLYKFHNYLCIDFSKFVCIYIYKIIILCETLYIKNDGKENGLFLIFFRICKGDNHCKKCEGPCGCVLKNRTGGDETRKTPLVEFLTIFRRSVFCRVQITMHGLTAHSRRGFYVKYLFTWKAINWPLDLRKRFLVTLSILDLILYSLEHTWSSCNPKLIECSATSLIICEPPIQIHAPIGNFFEFTNEIL